MIELPPLLRIQETVVIRHAPNIAAVVQRLAGWDAMPGMPLMEEEIAGVRAALLFALAIIQAREEQAEQRTEAKP